MAPVMDTSKTRRTVLAGLGAMLATGVGSTVPLDGNEPAAAARSVALEDVELCVVATAALARTFAGGDDERWRLLLRQALTLAEQYSITDFDAGFEALHGRLG